MTKTRRRKERARAYKLYPKWRKRHFKKQRGLCAICLEPMVEEKAQQGQAPNPRSVTLDHIIPLGLGGEEAFENTRAACWECNNREGKKLGAIMSPAGTKPR